MNLFNLGSSRSMVAGVAVSAASVVVPIAFGSSAESAKVDLVDGTAWLSSESAGNVVRVNGETGRVDARLDLGRLAGELLVAQGDGVVLVNLGGEVRSVDLANLDWSASTDGDGELVVGDQAAYMVSPEGEVRELDPSTLETIGSVDLDARPGPGVVADGKLVVPLDDGTVKVVDGDSVKASVDAGSAGDALHVTRVGDTVAVLNQSRQRLRLLDPSSGHAGGAEKIDLPAGELVVPTELPAGPLWLAATRSGTLAGVDLDSGDVTTAPVAEAMHQLTAPAAAEGRVYVVDRTTAQVLAVDAGSLDVVRREPLGITDASRVELVVEGGKVFVNDRASQLALVIDGDQVTRVDKYRDDGVATRSPPSDVPNLDPAPAANQGPSGAAPAPAANTPVAPTPPPPPPPSGPPDAPSSVSATAGNESATVSWEPGGGAPATAYHVSYRGGPTIDVLGDRASVPVDGLTNGDTYEFEVWASNGDGESEHVRSNEVVPNDEVPGAPSQVTAVDGDASATVRWAAADGRGNDIDRYIVTPSPATVAPVEVGGTETTATVPGLTNDTQYTFTVTAVNDRGNQSDPSSPSNVVAPWGAPGTVSGLQKTESNGSVGLTWQAALGHGPIHYVITASPSAGDPVTTDQTQRTFSGLTNGTTYTFTIVAVNDRGQGQGVQVQAMPGTQPTIDNARAERTGDRRFQVSFDVDNGGRPITSCTVRGAGSSQSCDASGGSGSATLDVPLFNTTYSFTINVSNSLGDANQTVQGTSDGKRLVVEAEVARWDGACWPSSRDGQRPYYRTAANNSCTGEIGWVNDGVTVQGLCHQQGEQIQDDYLNQSNQWIRIDRGGFMSTLYFENYTNTQAVIDGLPAC